VWYNAPDDILRSCFNLAVDDEENSHAEAALYADRPGENGLKHNSHSAISSGCSVYAQCKDKRVNSWRKQQISDNYWS